MSARADYYQARHEERLQDRAARGERAIRGFEFELCRVFLDATRGRDLRVFAAPSGLSAKAALVDAGFWGSDGRIAKGEAR